MALRVRGDVTDGPPPGGSYSPSVRLGPLVAVSGQCGYRPDRSLVPGLEAQTELALTNLRRALEAAGGSMESVLSVDVYPTDVDHFAAFDSVYAKAFEPPHPARTTVYCRLRPGVLVEVSALAVALEHD
jgi:2-iminobutanoate/2-iminopropanoate deaminase